MFPNTMPMVSGPSANPDMSQQLQQHLQYLQQMQAGRGAPAMPGITVAPNFQPKPPMSGGPNWNAFMQNARPSTNIEDHRR